jgi:hypothetical protein
MNKSPIQGWVLAGDNFLIQIRIWFQQNFKLLVQISQNLPWNLTSDLANSLHLQTPISTFTQSISESLVEALPWYDASSNARLLGN